jgi:hypothetical protein
MHGLTSAFVDQRKRKVALLILYSCAKFEIFNPMLLQNQNTKSQQLGAILGSTLKGMFGNALCN